MKRELSRLVFNIKNPDQFRTAAFEVFSQQASGNPVYREFIHLLKKDREVISDLNKLPYLPVEFFRNHRIVTGDLPVEAVFESSRTTGSVPSKHYISDLRLYEKSFLKAFSLFYGDPSGYLIAALLPSYVERSNSSLVYMVTRLIRESRDPESGFYRDDPGKLIKVLVKAATGKKKALLIGVSFALLDLAEKYSPDLSGITIMETGGMKGRRKELTREELHAVLKERFNVSSIHSEYGMTELLSQAYSGGNGIYYCPPWMKILISDPQDPLSVTGDPGITGGINIIDLANIHSCSFLSTGDLGRLHEDGGFEVRGRFDNSDIRGCNLMVE